MYDTLLNLDKSVVPLKCDRESNKEEIVYQNILKFYNKENKMTKDDFLEFMDEFKVLRSDYGIKKD